MRGTRVMLRKITRVQPWVARPLELLSRRQGDPALRPGHNHRLGNLRDRQLGFQNRGRGEGGADTGDNFEVDAFLVQQTHLLENGAVDRGVAALYPRHRLALPDRRNHQVHDLGQGQGLAAVDLGAGAGEIHDRWMDQ